MAAGNTYTQIASTTLGSAASSVTFSSIAGTYTDLVLVINGASSAGDSPLVYINGDYGSNYSETFLRGDGSAASSGRISSGGYINTAINPTANVRLMEILQFQNYSNTTTNKTVLWRGGTDANLVVLGVALWRNTAAINSILVNVGSGNFTTGSTFNLYGILAA